MDQFEHSLRLLDINLGRIIPTISQNNVDEIPCSCQLLVIDHFEQI